MREMLLVGLGGGVGSILRFKLSGLILHRYVDWKFPLPTFTVNVIGCVVAGLLWGLAEKRDLFTHNTRLLLFTGLLGGFTTFSAFGLETVALLRKNEMAIAAAYVALSVLCGVAAAWLAIAAVPNGR